MNKKEEIIKKISGPCVVLAGAGTGKTHTIVEKIKYLIKNKIYSPERIVCITFSNEAANNLMSRVQRALDIKDGNGPVIKTFHAFSSDLLRKHGEKIGINEKFNILDSDQSKVIIHRYLKITPGNCHKYISAIGNAKDLGINIESLKEYLDEKLLGFKDIDLEKRIESLRFSLRTLYLRKDLQKHEISDEINRIERILNLKKFVSAWSAYEKLKEIKNHQDYSDLNRNALRLLKTDETISENYDYIIVDEFQDTNKVQLDFLFYLAPHGNVTVVGDLNQSIYRFRGAYQKNFSEFKEKFNVGAKDIFNLDRSYRSSNKILRTAHNLILNNYTYKNECFQVLNFEDRDGDNIEVYELKDAREEARKIVEIIRGEIGNGRDTREVCVMFRTHQQGRIIKRALEIEDISYVSVSKNPLLKEKSIKKVVDYITILDKLKRRASGGEQAWWDLAYQLDFNEEDLIKVGRFIRDNKTSENLSALMLNSLCDIGLTDNGRMNARILIEKIKILLPMINNNVPELVKAVYNIAGLINSQKTKEEKVVMMNLNKFYELAKNHSSMYSPDLGSFIHYLEILDSLGIEISAADSESEGIRLMTSHATKGLEYNTVIITNLAQKRFPIEKVNLNSLIPSELSPEISDTDSSDYSIYEQERKNQLFEERRLCYVAFTRAKERLVLTYAQNYGGRKYYPSQFLTEINHKENSDVSFVLDNDEKYLEKTPEIKQAIEFASVIRDKNFEELIAGAIKNSEKSFNKKSITFSPSALLSFIECQKKYEYKYVYNMPEAKVVSWESIMLGSFIHRILDSGVKNNFSSLKQFEDFAREMHMDKDWEDVDLSETLHLIRVFFERNNKKYNKDSKTEQILKMQLGGLDFVGFADRIDFSPYGLEIIDYKTGKGDVSVRARDWQLGYYALAASSFGHVKKITLDMLKHERPLEFSLDDKGNAKPVHSTRMQGFNIYDVERELIKTAQEILNAYQNGFKPCAIEKNCEFCNEWVHRL